MTGFYRPWTDDDRIRVVAMHDAGASLREISRALERPYHSVRGAISNIRWLRVRKPPVYPSVRIPHADVPQWYELGWRFIGFDGDLCIFEWPCSGEPIGPQSKRVGKRELEAA